MSERKYYEQYDFTYVREHIKNVGMDSCIYVGTDSNPRNNVFVTSIVVHVGGANGTGRGAYGFYQSFREPRKLSMRERLLIEVAESVNVGLQIVDVVGERKMEVHIDVNPNRKYQSNIVFREASGYVEGQGFIVKTKPGSIAASAISDHMVRHGWKKNRAA